VELHRSAREHGVADDDIVHAASHALAAYALDDGDDEPRRTLLLGPDRAQATCSSSSSWNSTTLVGS